MKTKTTASVKNQQSAQVCKSVPCDIPPFCRNNYFTGKLLTERDLTAEQRYSSDKLRLHHLALHGWGVICGLKVRSHPYCPNLRVIVEPGLAIDPCGRFIRVLKEVEVELPKPAPPPPRSTDPCPPDAPKEEQYPKGGYDATPYPTNQGSYSSYAERNTQGYGALPGYTTGEGPQNYGPAGQTPQGYGPPPGYNPSEGPQNYGTPGQNPQGYGPPPGYNTGGGPQNYGTPGQRGPYQTGQPSGQGSYAPYPDDSQTSQPTVNLYFCLTYAESDDEMMPAPFDECACSDSGQKPNRICETYKLTVSIEPPDGLDQDPYECEQDNCLDLFNVLVDPCPAPLDLKCLQLAIVEDHVLGEAVTEDRIDNTSVRRILRSTQFLEQIIHCIAEKVPSRTLTQIVDIGWQHRGEYHSHDFMRQFIGDGSAPRGFEVTFGAPVRWEGITPRTFQAIAVRYEDPHSGGQMEVVPARVRVSDDRMKAFLEIDRRYAEHRLDHTRFDLYLLLRCNQIVDENGLPVDGELLARIDSDGNYIAAPPTGDGVAGGLFESWIRVVTETRR